MSSLRSAIPHWLEDADNGLSMGFRYLLAGLWRDLRMADERVAELDGQINAAAKADPDARRLQQRRGDAYVRSLLVHAARAMLRTAPRHDDPLSRWVTRLASRSHPNAACVAMANKTARMAWARLRQGTNYPPARAAA